MLRPCSSLLLAALGLALASCEPEGPSEPDAWSVPIKGLPGALLSVWGSASDDIWAVGADTGSGPAVMQYDGDRWQQHDTGATGTLWWVAGQGDDLWMVGDAGLVIHHDRVAGSFETLPAPGPERLYGVMPFAADDVRVVGGNDTDLGVIWQWDGADLERPERSASGPRRRPRLLQDLGRVGRGPVGRRRRRRAPAPHRLQLGAHPGRQQTFHRAWPRRPGPRRRWGLLRARGRARTRPGHRHHPARARSCSSTACTSARGRPSPSATRARFGAAPPTAAWTADADAPEVPLDYHATYVDPDGGIWAVGGRLADLPPTNGLLAHFGQPLAATTMPP